MLIKKDPDIIIPYLEDYSNLKGGFCSSVVFAESKEEIIDFLQSASNKKEPVTISGAGTGVAGARIPFGGTVLSLEKMNRILGIKNLPGGCAEAIVEPGLKLTDFLDKIEPEGLFYPPNPTEKSSFIGGNIATSASGARSFKYGTTRDYTLGLKMVLSGGKVVEISRGESFAKKRSLLLKPISGEAVNIELPDYNMPQTKNAAGYFIKDNMDAIDLFIGQEGTLSVITEIKIKLIKKPQEIIDCYAFFKKEQDAINFADKARSLSPGSIEFFSQGALELLKNKHRNLPQDAKGCIYFEQDIDKENEAAILDSWINIISSCGGSIEDTWFAQTARERSQLEAIRHDVPDMVNEIIKKNNTPKIGTDIAVPKSRINEMIEYYNGVLKEEGLRYLIFGHIGDCHLHVNILPKNMDEYKQGQKIYTFFAKKAIFLGGTVSAEHGIGKVKHNYLEMMYGKMGLEEMAHLKKTLDPACILGLDNIFPKELLK